MNAYNKKNVCTNKKWLSNRKIVADSFVTKITHYFNKNHKRLQQQKCVFTTSRKTRKPSSQKRGDTQTYMNAQKNLATSGV